MRGIARALMLRPLCCWPTSPPPPLDRVRAREVVELLAGETHAEGTATVMVTHDTAILDAADRVHELSDGCLT